MITPPADVVISTIPLAFDSRVTKSTMSTGGLPSRVTTLSLWRWP